MPARVISEEELLLTLGDVGSGGIPWASARQQSEALPWGYTLRWKTPRFSASGRSWFAP